ncbi:MAG: undecaprenyl-diphosphate phosphatase [Oscillospiraceae bacterium]|nr:undecaprenyl-diphosphate phosphatase [Oscillospiraceae bacterium]
MTVLQALLAGVIQGITEFLPVSSSGHLVIFHALFGEGEESNLAFTVFLHLATLLSVFIMFHKDIWTLIREFFASIGDLLKGKPNFKTPERRFLVMVILASIPTAIVGGLIMLLGLDDILENIFVVAVMLIITAGLMYLVDKMNKGKFTQADAPYKSSWMVGIAQGIAVLPGLSRSGTTIFAGLLGGLTKEFAVRFSFILSIPTILGAGLIQMIGVVRSDYIEPDLFSWAVGFVAATICGIFAIKFIKVLIKSSKFYIFSIYCLLASALAFLIGFGVIG